MRVEIARYNHLQTLPPMTEGWQEITAPGEKQVQSYGLVASCLGMLLVSTLLRGEFVPRGFFLTLLILVFTLPIHELIHALSTPNWGLSTKTVIGIQRDKGLFMPYVYYDGEQPLWHFLFTGLTPTILLTVLPLILIMSAPLNNSYRAGLGFLSFFNMAISGGDLVLVIWLLTHAHRRSYVRQNGWKLYWKARISD